MNYFSVKDSNKFNDKKRLRNRFEFLNKYGTQPQSRHPGLLLLKQSRRQSGRTATSDFSSFDFKDQNNFKEKPGQKLQQLHFLKFSFSQPSESGNF